jgi:hypothetical protein
MAHGKRKRVQDVARLRRRMVLVPLLLVPLMIVAAGPAGADPNTKTYRGTLTEQAFTEGCTSPVGLCAAGEAKGGLHGDFEITATNITPTSDPDVVILETSYVIHTNKGDISFSGQTLLNTVTGFFSSLDEVTGGTGKWAGATGTLMSSGNFSFATGFGEGEYTAVITTA